MGTLLRSCLTAVLASGLLTGCVTPKTESVRVATFNAYLLSPIFRCGALGDVAPDCFEQIEWPVLPVPGGDPLGLCTLHPALICDGITEKWARALADRVLANVEQLDILALNEVWDEDARAILVKRLSGAYQPIIAKIDEPLLSPGADGIEIAGEDSGLMLFARPGFVPEPLPDNTYRWGDNPIEFLNGVTSHVAFVRFSACGSEDCKAAKGAALVRLRHAPSGRIYNVVLTHMQADYPKDGQLFEDERDQQFADVETLLRKTLAPLDARLRDGEIVLFMGDINVPRLQSQSEWLKRFSTTSSFFTRPLFETWDEGASVRDRTPTNGNDRERFDYILASPGPLTAGTTNSRSLCVQHVTVPVAFQALESDHNMVHADLNRGFAHCNPAQALKLKVDETTPEQLVDRNAANQDITRISLPGAMQWFHVNPSPHDESIFSAYTVGTDNADKIAIDVFTPYDLTTPVAPYYERPILKSPANSRSLFRVHQYVLPAEFFVRVRAKDRATTENYSLFVRRNTCGSKEDACPLLPGHAQTATLSSVNETSPQDEAWFRFDAVGAPLSGGPQGLIVSSNVADPARVSATIEDFFDPAGLGAPPAGTPSGPFKIFTGPVNEGGHGYLVTRQISRGAQPTKVTGSLATNLRFLEIRQLICRDETNPEFGSDEIFTVFHIDGAQYRAPASGDVEFECDNNDDPHDWRFALPDGRAGFVDAAAVQIQEGDDVSADEASSARSAPSLMLGQDAVHDRFAWSFDGGSYEMEYSVLRRPNEPSALQP